MLSANMETLYWRKNKNWYTINEKEDRYELTDKAPERARRSFEMWKKTDRNK